MDVFDQYFRRADLDQDGKISGAEAVAFFQGSNLPKPVLALIWTLANQNQSNFLGRPEFYNALRLVTVAQSGRELTPDIVKAALFGPAAAKIPPPKIGPPAPAAPSAQQSSPAAPPPAAAAAQMGGFQNPGIRAPQLLPNQQQQQQQQSFPFPNNQMMRPTQGAPGAASVRMPAGNAAGPRFPSSGTPNLSTDWFGGRPGGAQAPPARGAAPAGQPGAALPQPGATPVAPAASAQPRSLDLVVSSTQPTQPAPNANANANANERSLVVSGNGFSSPDSVFGGDLFSAAPQPKTEASAFANLSSNALGSQNSVRPGQPNHLQSAASVPSVASQMQLNQRSMSAPTSMASNASVGPVAPAPGGPQLQWPRMTQSDVQKYTAVFVKVDKDRDGKITGEEARNLFLSWRLPREVLKQVWDLSDQDNDSMLSLREFCTALYLMERYREGCPLPAVLPNNLRLDEMAPSTGQPSTAYNSSSWQQNPGINQQVMSGPRPAMSVSGMKPPQAPIPSHSEDTVERQPPKSRVPVLEKHLVNQLSKEEQSALDSKFQDASDSEKKVQELEKEILDSREKTEYYRTKMQELVLYKSRCDNRLNEITERVSADKREVEVLARKYEDKYKQVAGDVASRMTLDEATFRDIQEKKMELYNAIVKMEQGGAADGVLKDRADQIQSELDELVKTLNERCKQYGLRAKPTSLVELPFGWQPGIQEGAADWDEDWDKFNDEGFAIIKELTIDVENVVVKPKSPPVQSDNTSTDEVSAVQSSPKEEKTEDEKPTSVGENTGEHFTEDDSTYAQSEDGLGRSPPGSPRRKTVEGLSPKFQSTHSGVHDNSPRMKESQSDHGGAESTISGDKYSDEPSWGANFDSNDDADSIWGINTNSKEADHDRNQHDSFFGAGDFGLNPIRTESPGAESVYRKDKSPFFDSVPSTPLHLSGSSPRFSSPRFNEGPEDHAFDRFSRFDSFSMNDTGPFATHDSFGRFDSMRSTADPPFATHDSFGRFDSMRSTTDPPFSSHDSFGRFDSMRSTADPPLGSLTRYDSMQSTSVSPLGNLARFDSIRSTADNARGFPSFDDADPFGSGPFKSTESETPRRGTDSWSAF
ncbi:epidermal growth factor receptor substrate 15-like [Iris pallida]|uniref:Epidermal growth factor receptor substrate 15-like n=1 Tax=Iris pallida TaxID=29817 RepID=A0AAX6HHW5_IRIPA|nr:epidermal growth factor receptor substrate 15-like [Iris pallida]